MCHPQQMLDQTKLSDVPAGGVRTPADLALEKVLVVDPDATTRLFYKTALQPLARAFTEAEDGAEALGKAICDRPTLVITGMRLPRVDGIALCSLLRSDPITADTKVVVVTGPTTPAVMNRAVAAGADAVLVQSCDADELIATVRRVCDASFARPGDTPAAATASPRVARVMRSRAHERRFTTRPPNPVPAAFCPQCGMALTYLHSHTGGVSDKYPEQWDYFTCARCGMYRYRHRTRRMSPVVEDIDGSQRKPA